MEESKMSEQENTLSRRRFIKTSCGACIASWLALSMGCKGKREIEEGETSLSEKEAETVPKMIAMCGLVCTECEAYIATQNDDHEAKVKVAEKWTKMWGVELTPEDVTCDGCQSETGRLSSYAGGGCEIRPCALERKVINCAYCNEYPCETLEKFFALAPESKTALEAIRKSF